jgi:hypothetical protein
LFYKFISDLASYVGTTQTGFLMAFLPMFRRNRNRDSCSKRSTGTEKNGIRRIPAGIGNLGMWCVYHIPGSDTCFLLSEDSKDLKVSVCHQHTPAIGTII